MPEDERRLRIIHVVDYLMPTMGYQEFLLPKWNAKHGHEVHVITSDRYYPIPNYEETWGQFLGPRKCGSGVEQIEEVTVHRLSCLWEWKKRPWLTGLQKKIEQLSPDVIFCHGTASPTSFRLATFSKKTGIPLLMDNHMIYVAQNRSPSGRLYYHILKTLSKRVLNSSVYRFFGVANECCDFLQREQNVPSNLVECLPLGVDTDLFKPDESGGRMQRSKYQIPLNAKVILQTGKLSRDKGAHWLAQASASIMKSDPNVWLCFVGSGTKDYLDYIHTLMVDQRINDRFIVIPFVSVPHLAAIYSMADICVYPAGTSLSCLEAAACGKPVVITDLPANKWRAELGVGVCYRTGDVNDLEATIERLLHNPNERQALGEQGRDSVIKHFSYDLIAYRTEEVIYGAISKQRK